MLTYEEIKIVRKEYNENDDKFEKRINSLLKTGWNLGNILEEYSQGEYNCGGTDPLFILWRDVTMVEAKKIEGP